MAMARSTIWLFMFASTVTCTQAKRSDSSLASDHVQLQTASRRFEVIAKRHVGQGTQAACCSACSGKAYCSPGSGRCYDQKNKDYYESCGANSTGQEPQPACCSTCGGKAYCSPGSGRCYDSKKKDYYESCGGKPAQQEPQPGCCSACGGKAYCSPGSGQCYDWKKKDYYESCGGKPASPSCCTDCAGKLGFFSPSSGNCYKSKSKDYYQACPAGDSNAPKGECKVGGDKWCAATVPDANFSLMTCPQLGMRIKAITYNLFWWNLFGQRGGNGGSAGRLISSANNPPFDFLGFQECDDVWWPLRDAGLSNSYGSTGGGYGQAIAYRKARWSLLSQGLRTVGEDRHDQYYGKRAVHWGRFRHSAEEMTAFVMNFHGPLPVGTGGAYGGTATANNILKVVRDSAQKSDAIIFLGDFNQPAWASMIPALSKSLSRLYTGKSFGGVDHIFSSCGADRVVSRRNLGTGGSDHDALEIVIKM